MLYCIIITGRSDGEVQTANRTLLLCFLSSFLLQTSHRDSLESKHLSLGCVERTATVQHVTLFFVAQYCIF